MYRVPLLPTYAWSCCRLNPLWSRSPQTSILRSWNLRSKFMAVLARLGQSAIPPLGPAATYIQTQTGIHSDMNIVTVDPTCRR